MPVSYTDLRAAENVSYCFVPDLIALARDVDALVVATSGGAGSKNLVNTAVLNALGPKGLLINIARDDRFHETCIMEPMG